MVVLLADGLLAVIFGLSEEALTDDPFGVAPSLAPNVGAFSKDLDFDLVLLPLFVCREKKSMFWF